MYCPKCGKSDQQPLTYCRQCGIYLENYDRPAKKVTPPEQHLKANAVLSFLTAITSLTLAILLFSIFLGRDNTPVIIYVTAGFLMAMTAWQVQTFWRTILLRKHFKKRKKLERASNSDQEDEPQLMESPPTNRLLPEGDRANFVPPSVVEGTTRKLKAEKSS